MKKRNKKPISEFSQEFEEPMVGLFESWYSLSPIKIIKITEFLFTEKYKEQVETYRDKKTYYMEKDRIKAFIECIMPSGNLRRRDKYLDWEDGEYFGKRSGLICIDLDSKDNEDIDLAKSKHIIGQHCPSLYYAGLSISGEGIFLLFRVSNPERHRQHFYALMYYLKEKFNLNVDRVVQSPVSMRAASYDAEPYFNPNPVPFKLTMDIRDSPMPIARTVRQKQEIREHVEKAIRLIKVNSVDMTNRYQAWFKIGCAFAHEFGEEGRGWFHTVSCKHARYNEIECDRQYDKCLQYDNKQITIASFFYYCKKFEIRYWVKY